MTSRRKGQSFSHLIAMTDTKRRIWIFVDWDETITYRDTLHLIAPPDSQAPSAPPSFSFFSDYYMKLLKEHEREFGQRHTLERQLDFLGSLSAVENASVSKVEEHGLFKGVTNEELYERGKQVRFRDGWEKFTKQVTESSNCSLVAILSVSWSAVFIEGALKRVLNEESMKQLEIRANVNTVVWRILT